MARQLGRSSSGVNRERTRNRLPLGGDKPSFAEGTYLARREQIVMLGALLAESGGRYRAK